MNEASQLCRGVLAKNPAHFEALNLLGVIALQAGNAAEAVRLMEQVIALRPTVAEYYVNIAPALQALGRFDDAVAACEKAIKLKPDIVGAHQNMAQAKQAQGRLDEAEKCCRKSISLDPNYPPAYNSLALSLHGQGRSSEAEVVARQAIKIAPTFSQAWSTLGLLLMDAGRLDESRAVIERSIALNPNSPTAHYNYAVALLLSGDLQRGFTEYEWRWRCPSHIHLVPPLPSVQWDGSDSPGKTLFLHAEQGLGDTIQFIRYVPLIAARCKRVVVACPRELHPLLAGMKEISQLLGPEEVAEGIDAHLPLMSAPRVCGTTLQSIPATIPYLSADAAAIEHWKPRIAGPSGKMTVGLAWTGNPLHRNDLNRTIPLAALARLSQVANIAWFNLQKFAPQTRAELPNLPLIDCTAELLDFSATAALVANLDLIITADTVVAHLAGAMGKPVWILLPFAPDWRWLRDRENSPWYPTAQLFRQPSFGDWSSVIQRVNDDLKSRINNENC